MGLSTPSQGCGQEEKEREGGGGGESKVPKTTGRIHATVFCMSYYEFKEAKAKTTSPLIWVCKI